MHNDKPSLSQIHSFLVRIWWEPGLTRPDGRPLWRGQVQHAASSQTCAFQSLDEMLRFIQDQAGELEPTNNGESLNK
ncbi:MAG: hypothetical protein SXV54_15080 [Chloroflexota bacterium]|nr:hypothetical protein [Chloroflexota bacterium]